MEQKYRVAHIGTGYTGSIALRHVLRSPCLELVGLRSILHSKMRCTALYGAA
jgi:hypothetical protein